MEAGRKRNIRSGEQYSHLFPKAEGINKTIRTNADVTHTVAFIPKVVNETLDQTEKIAQLLKANEKMILPETVLVLILQILSQGG